MGKLYKKYNELKTQDSSVIYLFKSGIFYICLDKDADKLNELLGLKLTNFDGNILKCGFPTNSLGDYLIKMENSGIKYKLIDSNLNSIESPKEYMNSLNVKKIISTLQKLDIDDTSPKEALNILSNLKELSIF